MDEPTTHLDMPSIDALVDALDQFEGTLIFISHDVYFIRALANRVVHVDSGKLTTYPGDYQYYLDKTARKAVPVQKVAERPVAKAKSQKRIEAEERQAMARQRRDQQKVVSDLEKQIHELERRQTELAAELEKPETYEKTGQVMQLNRELTHVTDDLHRLTTEWESAAGKLAELGTNG
jgi:ATP-binding cassette subfamily F protein 3